MAEFTTIILNDVQQRAARLSSKKADPALAPGPDDQTLLHTFFDHGVMKIATVAGTIRDSERDRLEENVDTGEITTSTTQDNVDPPYSPDELVPSELYNALIYWILKEWFESIGEGTLANYYLVAYTGELAAHRFTNVKKTAQRPYRPV